MGFAAIDPHGEQWEGVAVQGMGRISNGDFTRQLFKEWGISLYLIRWAARLRGGAQRRPDHDSVGSGDGAHAGPLAQTADEPPGRTQAAAAGRPLAARERRGPLRHLFTRGSHRLRGRLRAWLRAQFAHPAIAHDALRT